MQFRTAQPIGIIDGTNTIELWDEGRLAATVHALRSGLQVECAPGYELDYPSMEIQAQPPPQGVTVGLRRA